MGFLDVPRDVDRRYYQLYHNQMMLLSDMVLAWDPEFRKVLEEYAEDEDLLDLLDAAN